MGLVIGILLLAVMLVAGFSLVTAAATVLWWLAVGVIVGALARLMLPGRQLIGWIETSLYGMAGALIGGVFADQAFGISGLGQFVLSVAGAAVLIALFAAGGASSTRTRGR